VYHPLCPELALTFMKLEGQMICWIHCLQEYNFTSEHWQGQKHTHADLLSRRPYQ
jgi:hypothetical protein